MKKILIFLIFVCIYFLRLKFSQNLFIKAGTWLRLTGRVLAEPYRTTTNQLIYLDNFLLKTTRQPQYHYNDVLEVVGKVEGTVTKNNRRYFVLNHPTIHQRYPLNTSFNQSAAVGEQVPLYRRTQDWLAARLASLLPSPHAELLAGMVLGSKRQLPEELTQKLRDTGTIHLVVASGYNLTLVAGLLGVVGQRYLKRDFIIVISLLAILGYTWLAGSEPPIVRAAIMSSCGYLAALAGRENRATRALWLTAAIMLLVTPRLLTDPGFQLSLAATAGLLYLRWPRLPALVGATLAAQAATLPLLIYHFGRFNLLSLPLNLLVTPVIPIVMILGGLTLLTSWLPLVGQLLAWLVYPVMQYFLFWVKIFAT